MVMRGEERVCSTCNAEPGERVTVSFVDNDNSVTVRLCEECHTEFAADDRIELTFVEE